MGEIMIPKIIHQIWVKGTNRPAQTYEWAKRLQALNPDWEYQLHEVDAVDGVKPQHVANVTRMELLSVIGGVYLDCDMEPFAPLELLGMDLTSGNAYCDLFLGCPHHAFLAAPTGNPTVTALATLWRQMLHDRVSDGYMQTLRPYAPCLTTLKFIASPVGNNGVSPVLYHHMLSRSVK